MTRELGLIEVLQELIPPVLVPLFVGITALGSARVLTVVLALVYWLDADARDRGAFVISMAFGAVALTVGVKAIFGFPRPPSELHLIPVGGYGFPSGHAIQASIVYGTLGAVYSDGTRRWPRLAAAGLIGVIGLSRVVLGVHYTVDVLAGVALGAGYLAGAYALTRRDPHRGFWLAVLVAGLAIVLTGASPGAVVRLGAAVSAALTWRGIAGSPHLQAPLPGWIVAVVGLPLLAVLGYLGDAAAGSLPLAVLLYALVPTSVLGLPIARAQYGPGTQPP